MANGTEQARWLGVSVDKWVSIVQTLGIPSLFMIFVCYLLWSYTPPIVQGHVDLLQRTGDAIESIDKTMQAVNRSLEEVVSAERATKAFCASVEEQHAEHSKKLDTIIGAVENPR